MMEATSHGSELQRVKLAARAETKQDIQKAGKSEVLPQTRHGSVSPFLFFFLLFLSPSSGIVSHNDILIF